MPSIARSSPVLYLPPNMTGVPECAVPVERDTSIGGPNAAFPLTRPSIVAAATSPDEVQRRAACGTIIATYWKPVYKYIRLKWRKDNEDAKDLTQAFLAEFVGTGLSRFDPARGSLRTFVRVSVDGFVSHDARAATRLKRGGGLVVVPLEDADGDRGDLIAEPGLSMEDHFHREWQRQLFTLAIEDLRALARTSGRLVPLAVFEAHDLVEDPPSYGALAVTFGVTPATVTNHLAWARRELRRLVLVRIDAATASTAEAVREARALFGRA